MSGQDGLLGTFEQLVLLAALNAGDEAFPPQLMGLIETASGRAPSRGAVYVTLDRLEAKGLIASSAVAPGPDRGGRPRRLVAVTDDGIAALQEARDAIGALWSSLETTEES
jgi:DNA-binding PadR family transcriptional regulator